MPDVLGLIALSADGKKVDACRFEASIDGGPLGPAAGGKSPYVLLPPSPRPLRVTIVATPPGKTWFPLRGEFELRGAGDLRAIDAPAEFQPLLGLVFEIAAARGSATNLAVHLSSVRDVTRDALEACGAPGPGRASPATWPPGTGAPWPPRAWDAPPRPALHYVATPPAAGGALRFERRTIDPDTEDLVLELCTAPEERAPRWLAVSWPRAIARTPAPTPAPFLLYFRAGVTQNVARGYYHDAYPASFDYAYLGLWRYLQYPSDPLAGDWYAKGLPYQIAASGKPVVLVLPLPAAHQELGLFMNAANVERALREVQAFMLRRAGVYASPPLGRTALAAFSSGNAAAARFLADNAAHPFVRHTLEEVYMFDAPDVAAWADAVGGWAKGAAKRVRAYVRRPHERLAALVGRALSPSPALDVSPDGLRSVLVATTADWADAYRAATGAEPPRDLDGGSQYVWQGAHQLHAALMLTDGLRRSAF